MSYSLIQDTVLKMGKGAYPAQDYAIDKDPKNINVLYTFDKDLDYYPIINELDLNIGEQIIWIIFYPICWAIIIYLLYDKQYKLYYIIGFLSGIIILAIDSYLYNSPNWPIINKYNQQVYTTKDEEEYEKAFFATPTKEAADYKVLLKNTVLPRNNIYGYMLTDDKLEKLKQEGKVTTMDLAKMYNKYFDEKIGFDSQKDAEYYSLKNTRLSRVSFYIIVLCITLAVYISHTKYFNYHHLFWIFMTCLASVIASGFVFITNTMHRANYILFIKERLLILAISLAITSVLLA